MNIDVADVGLHITETPTAQELDGIEAGLRHIEGVVSVHSQPHNPHLMIVGFNPARVHGPELVGAVTHLGFHAQVVGL
jgi:hypothetical protein